MNAFLYLSVVLIWGSTWLAIAMQQGQVASLISIFYRFAVAGAIMIVFMLATRRLRRFSLKDHLFCLLQGCLIFGFNFYCVYQAAAYITSGLESVIFSMAVMFNAVNSVIFFRQKLSANILPACLLGLIGIIALFWQDLFANEVAFDSLKGIGLCVIGTFSFSLGNMVSLRQQRHGLDILSSNTYAMTYGAIVVAIIASVQGLSFLPDFSLRYIGSLLYLSVFGSVIAFAAYFSLIGRIGASQAAYSTLLSPLVALGLSTVYEGYQWQINAVFGLALILLGNLVMFAKFEFSVKKLLNKLFPGQHKEKTAAKSPVLTDE
jgi:drug/metabolite transporter (DMT)-like permease